VMGHKGMEGGDCRQKMKGDEHVAQKKKTRWLNNKKTTIIKRRGN
jgi:hypothetical protein